MYNTSEEYIKSIQSANRGRWESRFKLNGEEIKLNYSQVKYYNKAMSECSVGNVSSGYIEIDLLELEKTYTKGEGLLSNENEDYVVDDILRMLSLDSYGALIDVQTEERIDLTDAVIEWEMIYKSVSMLDAVAANEKDEISEDDILNTFLLDVPKNIQISDGTVIPMGVFNVFEMTDKKITAYDNVCKLDGSYETALTYPTSAYNVISEVETHCGVSISNKGEIADMTITEALDASTYRGALAEIAKLNGKNVVCDRTGALEFKWFSDAMAYDADNYYSMDVNCRGVSITSVIGVTDDETLTSGDSGDSITINSPYVTQELIDSLLQGLTIEYAGADVVLLGNPCLDLMDVLTITTETGEVYRVPIMENQFIFDGGCTSSISSFADGELSSSYTYDSASQKYITIAKSVEGFRVEVGDLAKETMSRFDQTDEKIATEVQNAKDEASSLIEQTANSITAQVQDVKNETTSSIQQLASEISLKVDAGSVINAINVSTEGVRIDASKVNITGYVTFSDLSSNGSTTINGANITTGTIAADRIDVDNLVVKKLESYGAAATEYNIPRSMTLSSHGGRVYVYTGTNWDSATYRCGLVDQGLFANMIKVSTVTTDTVSCSGAGTFGSVTTTKINGYTPINSGNISSYLPSVPSSTSGLGANVTSYNNILFGQGNADSYQKYNALSVYTFNNSNTSSDRRLKHDIQEIDFDIADVYMDFEPVQFKYNDGLYDDIKISTGLVAQDVAAAFEKNGISWEDYELVKVTGNTYEEQDRYTDGTHYGINYDNMHAYHITMIQKQQKAIEALEARISELEKLQKMA